MLSMYMITGVAAFIYAITLMVPYDHETRREYGKRVVTYLYTILPPMIFVVMSNYCLHTKKNMCSYVAIINTFIAVAWFAVSSVMVMHKKMLYLL